MGNDRNLTITVGSSRKAVVWQQVQTTWLKFAEKLKEPQRSSETYSEYMKLPKGQQDELKDVGGYVGGTLTGTRRKASNMTGRDLITLDLDSIGEGLTETITNTIATLGCASVVYSTRKHSPRAPRLRVVIPLDRTCAPDEYEPVARMVAKFIGIDYCDPTTFEAVRLMYWPSCSSDGEYVYKFRDAQFCSVDGILALYENWKDASQWPQQAEEGALTRRNIAKQEDPTKKNGLVGAFCRVYDVPAAMDAFIPGVYEETPEAGRYTYVGGSTTGGAVCYDDGKFLFSHHATDPVSGQLVNAFDLIRIHKFGDRDEEAREGTPVSKMPSYHLMMELAGHDEAVSKRLAQERLQQAQDTYAGTPTAAEAFGGSPEVNNETVSSPDDSDWIKHLSVGSSGKIDKTISNVHLILRNDPNVKDRIKTDTFSNRGMIDCPVPWDASEGRRQWQDCDFDGIYEYIETLYGINSRTAIDSAVSLIGLENKINEVEAYIKSCTWDGVKRVDTLLTDYLGAPDNVYTRSVIRKSLVAAVARAIEGGVKYDTMPIFTGPQGIGKSTFLANLGRQWFSDSLTTFEGKDAAELIAGTWINEIGELTAMSRQDMNSVKQFLSKRDDRFRAAYGRTATSYPRHCVFFGTSNEAEFLRDQENRRFWPVDVGVIPATKSVWREMPLVVDQIWAEAFIYYQMGEPLIMEGEAAQMALDAQRGHREADSIEGMVLNYLDMKVPVNWNDMDMTQKRTFIAGNMTILDPENELESINQVCAVEFYELNMGNKRYMKNVDAKKINDIIRKSKGWDSDVIRFKEYGIQRGFRRRK